MRLSNNSLLKHRVNKLCPIEYVRSNREELVEVIEKNQNLTGSRREAAEIGDLRRRFAE